MRHGFVSGLFLNIIAATMWANDSVRPANGSEPFQRGPVIRKHPRNFKNRKPFSVVFSRCLVRHLKPT